jgi:hypothetical protein
MYETLGASGVKIIGRQRNLCGAQNSTQAPNPQYFICDVSGWRLLILYMILESKRQSHFY